MAGPPNLNSQPLDMLRLTQLITGGGFQTTIDDERQRRAGLARTGSLLEGAGRHGSEVTPSLSLNPPRLGSEERLEGIVGETVPD